MLGVQIDENIQALQIRRCLTMGGAFAIVMRLKRVEEATASGIISIINLYLRIWHIFGRYQSRYPRRAGAPSYMPVVDASYKAVSGGIVDFWVAIRNLRTPEHGPSCPDTPIQVSIIWCTAQLNDHW